MEERSLKLSCLDQGLYKNTANFFLNAYENIRGGPLEIGSRVLDFGCGSGATVEELAGRGYAASGVDILEYWGRDAEMLGHVPPPLHPEMSDRLHKIDPGDNRLPFPDESFDMIISDQVLEHVFDYVPVFREQGRVLKAGGLALDRFPPGTLLREPHTKLPLAPLSHSRVYLALWAMAGRRNDRQANMTWRETLVANSALMGTTNYRSRAYIVDAAQSAGVRACFRDYYHLDSRSAGRHYRILAKAGLGGVVALALRPLTNRLLVIEKSP